MSGTPCGRRSVSRQPAEDTEIFGCPMSVGPISVPGVKRKTGVMLVTPYSCDDLAVSMVGV